MAESRRHILIVVAGLTPAIITETLQFLTFGEPGRPLSYQDLSRGRDVRMKISEIFVVTTSMGRARIVDELFNKGGFEELCNEYGINWVKFSEENIYVLKDKGKNEISDIRTIEENKRAADELINFIRNKTDKEKENTVIHCSIAGGRKSMDIYVAFALQFYGRRDDKMYHVLVNPPFDNPNLRDEKGRGFLYIPMNEVIFTDIRSNSEHASTAAEIALYEIPYVHLRNKLEEIWPEILACGNSYDEMVEIAQREIDLSTVEPYLIIDLGRGTVYISRYEVKLIVTEFFIYSYFALSRKLCSEKHGDENCPDCFPDFKVVSKAKSRRDKINARVKFKEGEALSRMERVIKNLAGMKSREYRTIERWLRSGIPMQSLRDKITDIRKKIKEVLHGAKICELIQISNFGRYGEPRYGIKLGKDKIEIRESSTI
jgi:CRISPR-associated protein Csx14